ncbi:DUF6082 family protein [Nonomuraea sp. NPDC004702]
MIRVLIVIFSAISALGLLVTVSLLPTLLQELGNLLSHDRPPLASIGNVYSSASAILFGTAFLGVTISLIIQASQARAGRIQAVRQAHREIITFCLENTAISRPVLGLPEEMSEEAYQQHLLTVNYINYLRTGYESRVISENSLRSEIFPRLFRRSAGRQWYQKASATMASAHANRREKKFYRILTDEYRKASPTPAPS